VGETVPETNELCRSNIHMLRLRVGLDVVPFIEISKLGLALYSMFGHSLGALVWRLQPIYISSDRPNYIRFLITASISLRSVHSMPRIETLLPNVTTKMIAQT